MPDTLPKNRHRPTVRRAKQARSKATVETIIEAATQVLANAGWQGFNTNVIAQRAGVSIGSIYEYFANKQAIIDTVINRHLTRGEVLLSAKAQALNDESGPDEIVSLLVSGFIDVHQDEPQLHGVLSTEVPLSPEQRERVITLRANIIDAIADALAKHVSLPSIKATILVDTADALSHRWLIDTVGNPVSASLMSAELEKMLRAYLYS